MRSLVSSPDGSLPRCRPHSPFCAPRRDSNVAESIEIDDPGSIRSSPTQARRGASRRCRNPIEQRPAHRSGDGHQRPVRDPPEPRQRGHGRGVPRLRPDHAADGRAEDRARRVAHARRRRGAAPGAPARALGEPPERLPRARPRPEPLGPHPGDGAHRRADAAHAHPPKKAQGGYTADEFRKIASEVCAGLAAIHAQGLVHGDLKPGNVMVTDDKRASSSTSASRKSARASRRAGPARRPTAAPRTTCRPERLRSRRRQRRRRRLRARR